MDISCDEGMGVQSSRATTIEEPIYIHKGVMHYAVGHTPTLFYKSASDAISRAAGPFIDLLVEGSKMRCFIMQRLYEPDRYWMNGLHVSRKDK